METSLKQRLLGAALLIALAVIFIPMLFDGDEREGPVTLDMDAPPEPEYTFEEPSKSRPAPMPKVQKPSEPPTPKRITPTELAGLGQSRPGDARSASPRNQSSALRSASDAKRASTSDDSTKQLANAAPPAGGALNDPRHADSRQPLSPPPKPSSSSRQRASSSAAPKDWAVQVGSFSEHENATSLRNELRGAGFTAFEERVVSGGEPVFRVKVGPAVNRPRAEALQAKLRNQEDLNGIVVNHRATADR